MIKRTAEADTSVNIEIEEYKESKLVTLNEIQLKILLSEYSNCVTLLPADTNGQYRIKGRNFCGVLHLPELNIYVHPKVPVENVFQMLAAVDGFDELKEDIAGYANTDGISGALAYVFCKRLYNELMKNKHKGYLCIEEDLKCVRGRILVHENIRRNALRPYSIYCRYDEFSPDILLNQVLKAACSRLHCFSLGKMTKSMLHANLDSLHDVSDLVISSAAVGKITFDRLSIRYKFLVYLAELILGSTVVDHKCGEYSFSSFLVNMNNLFERYVRSVVSMNLPDGAKMHGREITNYLDVDRKISLKPDVVIEKGGSLIIIDAKYKGLDTAEASNSDIYQMFSYCHSYRSNSAILLYPLGEGPDQGTYQIINGGPSIHVRKIDLQKNNEDVGKWANEFILHCFKQ